MATEYTVWLFDAYHLMQDFDTTDFQQHAGSVANKLTELAKGGWTVVAQSVLPEVVNGFGMSLEEQQQIGTKLRLIYTLAREISSDMPGTKSNAQPGS